MTNPLDRRVAKLEAAARAANTEGSAHLVLVRPGEDRDEQVGRLGVIGPGDQVIVVNFLRPCDVESPSTLQ